MRTSVPGPSERRSRGFTLIELMVVLVIIGVAVAAVGVQNLAPRGRGAREDASRLMQLLAAAQNEARADGRPITWQYDDAGFRFVRDGRLPLAAGPVSQAAVDALPPDTFADDTLLRPRAWLAAPMRVAVEPAGPAVLTAEWLGEPLVIRLHAGDGDSAVTRDAAGRLRLQ